MWLLKEEFRVTDSEAAEQLKRRLKLAIGEIKPNDIGVAFSGGVDSSLLAKMCKDAGKNTTLLTVGFTSRTDIDVSIDVAEMIGLKIRYDLVPLEELENGLKTVLAKIDFDRIVRFENCVCFYYVFRLASREGLGTVVSANGIDELFCGYTAYKTCYGSETTTKEMMKNLVNVANEDKAEMDKIASLFGIDYQCPFLFGNFVDFAKQIPLNLKIRGSDDNVRKHILREVALNIGVPPQAALRSKKAFQYSSGIHKAIIELAKTSGFTKSKAKAAGFKTEKDNYISNLRSST
jgi:asparagine synthase (glutamine-hydrolysing)